MRTNRTGGFTLIELLIVIAIIGILAAVLIPNLLNARQQAQLRAAQAYGSQVYTIGNALLAEAIALTPADIATPLNTACGADTPQGSPFTITKDTITYTLNYGIAAAPGIIDSCTVTEDAGMLYVVVQLPEGTNGGRIYSLNGGEWTATDPTPAG